MNDSITREAFAVALYAAYGEGGRFEPKYLLRLVPTDSSTLNQFSDKNEISAWATTAVAWAVSNGIMGGSDGAISRELKSR